MKSPRADICCVCVCQTHRTEFEKSTNRWRQTMETDWRKAAEPPGIKTSGGQLQEAAEVKGRPGGKRRPAKDCGKTVPV